MHSIILQLSEKELLQEDFADEHSIPDWFVGCYANYAVLLTKPEHKQNGVMCVSNFLGASYKDGKLTITKDCCMKYLSNKLERFRNAVSNLSAVGSVEKYLSRETKEYIQDLKTAVNDKFSFWIHKDEEMLTLDQFIEEVGSSLISNDKEEAVFYTGAIWDYHF